MQQQGRFARPVGTQQSDALSGGDFEADPVENRGSVGVLKGEVLDFEADQRTRAMMATIIAVAAGASPAIQVRMGISARRARGQVPS